MAKTNTSRISGLTAANLINPNPIAQWETIPSTVYMKPPAVPPTYNDPVQGACNSCYFMAALSAVAWISPSLLSTAASSIGFYATPGGQKTIVSVTTQLPTDASHNLIYARCSDSGETWPAIYEKAYAKWKGCCGADPDKPVYANLPWGNAVTALKEILGYTNVVQKDASAYNPADIACNANGKATKPWVAWTKAAVSQAGLYPNHSYALLGKFGTDYIVLRNPYGGLVNEPMTNVATGVWPATGVNLATLDGVFALKIDAFKSNFAYYGSVWA